MHAAAMNVLGLGVGSGPAFGSLAPARVGDDPAGLRQALIRYWTVMHSVSAGDRLSGLASVHVADGLDRQALRAISVFALGDFESVVVFEATRRYLEFSDPSSRLSDYRVVDALQWAGRGLTLRPEGVFAALLCLCDEAVNVELVLRRSVTSCRAVRGVLAQAGVTEDELTREFLDGWGE